MMLVQMIIFLCPVYSFTFSRLFFINFPPCVSLYISATCLAFSSSAPLPFAAPFPISLSSQIPNQNHANPYLSVPKFLTKTMLSHISQFPNSQPKPCYPISLSSQIPNHNHAIPYLSVPKFPTKTMLSHIFQFPNS